MSLICTVCGEWYPCRGPDQIDICPPCYQENFAGAQLPLEAPRAAPSARDLLEAAVDSPTHLTLTPRQVQQLVRRHSRRLVREAEEED